MSTRLEDRLSAALRARAEQVEHTDLQPPAPPEEGRGWLRPATYGLLAAAAVAAVAMVPFTLGDHDTPQPATPSPTPTRTTATPGHWKVDGVGLPADFDGDGRPDKIGLFTSGGGFSITLAADPTHPLEVHWAGESEIVGAADIGDPGQALVVSTPDQAGGTTASVWRVVGGRLVEAKTADGSVLSGGSSSTTFVENRTLYWSAWSTAGDPRQLAFAATYAYHLTGDSLLSTKVGNWCVVPQSALDVHPEPCTAGQGPGLGSKDGLPPLLPGPDAWVSAGSFMDLPGGGNLGIVGRELVARLPRGDVKAPLPLSGGRLSVVPITPVKDDPVYLVEQATGAAHVFTAYLFKGGTLTRLTNASSLDLIDGAIATGRLHTWQGADGLMYTAVAQDSELRNLPLYQWSVVGTALHATKIGVVCLDLDNQDYGNCLK